MRERERGPAGAPTGDRVEEPVRVGACRCGATPNTSHSPASSRSAAATTAAAAPASTRVAAPTGSGDGERAVDRAAAARAACGRLAAPAGAPRAAGGLRPRRGGATSAGGHLPQPPGVPAESGSGSQRHRLSRCARLRADASVARVVATSESSGIGMGRARPHGLDEASSCARWPLSCPTSARRDVLPRGGPDGDLPEVVEPARCGRPPATSSVSFGKRRVPAGDVGDRADRPVGEPQRDVHVVRSAPAARSTSTGGLVEPPAHGVDEVAALAGEAGSLELLVEVPAAGVQRPGVDEVARRRGAGVRRRTASCSSVSSGAKRRLKPTMSRSLPVASTASSDAGRAARRSARAASRRTPPCRVSSAAAHQRGVRVVPGHDEHGVERLVVEHGVRVGGAVREAELALRVDAGQRRRGRDVDQVDAVVASRRCGSSIDARSCRPR